MDIKIEYAVKPGHLIAKASGTWTFASAKDGVDQIREKALETGLQRILVDITSMTLPDENMLRYDTGVYIAKVFRPPFRIAMVGGRPERIDHFMETVAANRGTRIRVFVEMEPALEWLLSDITA